MAAVTITPDDLAPFADIEPVKAQAMIDDAMALAATVAPCIIQPDFEYPEAAKAILRRAILRWNDAGAGAVTQETAGPFQIAVDTRQQRSNLFWPSEIDQLQKLCSSGSSGAFTIDTVGSRSAHLPWCNLAFGATWCSCGTDIAGRPIYELD